MTYGSENQSHLELQMTYDSENICVPYYLFNSIRLVVKFTL